ncbi:uncharacterized protein LODBEIA_P58350 [Lodderomyces beijingensis]|uniref:Symplekin/Pta1 N-terminal domain-containing protein n=1 Tax=Lodderomyces beijingensis TaxID=1775926 RepID=A0ABP0ZW27_9ASCO
MTEVAQNSDLVIGQLNTAKQLVVSQPDHFLSVFKGILPIVSNATQSYPVRKWGVDFIYDTFVNNFNPNLKSGERVELAIDSLDTLIFLIDLSTNLQHQHQQLQQQGQQSKIQPQELDVATFRHLIDISTIVYKLVFQYVSENDNCNQIWSKLTELKNSLVNKFQTTYPLGKSDNEEHDLKRNIATKLDLLKFLMTVIDFQSKTQVIGDGVETAGFNLNSVRPDHGLIKYQNMEYESSTLFTLVLKLFQTDIIVPTIITAALNHSMIILKKKPQLAAPLLKAVSAYDTNKKLQSNYQSVEEFKLAKKYVDRAIRIFISYAKRNNLIPTSLKSSLDSQMKVLEDRGNAIKKINIFNTDEPNIRKRKFEGFYNPSKKIKVLDYKHLYALDKDEGLAGFDLSSIQQQGVHANIVLNALRKVSVQRLTKALEIIAERYRDALTRPAPAMVKQENGSGYPAAARNNGSSNNNGGGIGHLKGNGLGNGNNIGTNNDGTDNYDGAAAAAAGGGGGGGGGGDGEDDADDVDDDEFDDEPIFTLPPPSDLSFDEKKRHLSIIINNFFKLAKAPPSNNRVAPPVPPKTIKDEEGDRQLSINEQLTDVAIKSFNKDTWVLLLTRLATRGMRTVAEEDEAAEKSPDDVNKEEMSNMIRESIFNYFVEVIHARIDVAIDWLNEEWFSEQVFQQNRLLSKADKSVTEVSTDEVETPIYYKWATKVIDSMINFIEPNDKKIFIRLLSDLPALNAEMLHKLKKLCFDPARSGVGFLALHYLIMYRPPVKSICVDILKELSESDQEDVRDEAKKKLARI